MTTVLNISLLSTKKSLTNKEVHLLEYIMRSILIVVLIFFLSIPNLLALETLGSGYECDGTNVLLKGKMLTPAQARKKTKNRLSKVKKKRTSAKRQGGSKKKLAKLNRQFKKLKDLKKQVAACLNGSVTPTSQSAVEVARTITGNYPNGQYAIVNEELPLQGNMTGNFTLDGTIFSGAIGFDGLFQVLFGEDPITFSQDIKDLSFPLVFETPPTPIGKIVIEFNEDRSLVFTAPDVPSDEIDRITYTGAYTDERGFDGAIQMIDNAGKTVVSGALTIAP